MIVSVLHEFFYALFYLRDHLVNVTERSGFRLFHSRNLIHITVEHIIVSWQGVINPRSWTKNIRKVDSGLPFFEMTVRYRL